jgi:hypothetical protein
VSTSTRQQIVEVIERALEPYGSLPIDAAAALVARPELLRALADEVQLPEELAAGYVIARHEDATKYHGDRTLSL